MNSITRHVTPKTLCAQLRMERQTHRGIFFLMEGSNDFRRFDKFLDRSQISVIVCSGKKNVKDTIDISQEAGFEDCVGFVDNDFDLIEKNPKTNEDIICSTYHDFEIDICCTEVVKRYLDEVANHSKVTNEGGCKNFISSLLGLLRPLSALRYANVKHSLYYSLRDLRVHKFFDGYKLDIDAMLDETFQNRNASETKKKALREYISLYAARNFDLWQFTNGHDLVTALGIALQNRIGDRLVPLSTRGEVEKHLRLAFDHADFHASGLAKKIGEWGENHGRFGLLRKIP